MIFFLILNKGHYHFLLHAVLQGDWVSPRLADLFTRTTIRKKELLAKINRLYLSDLCCPFGHRVCMFYLFYINPTIIY